MRALGVFLVKVKQALAAGSTAVVVRVLLEGRRVEITRLRSDMDRQLAALDARLALVEGHPDMTDYPVTTKPAPAVRLASLSELVDPDDADVLHPTFGRLFTRLAHLLQDGAMTAQGPPWSLYGTTGEDGLRVTAALPVGEVAEAPSDVDIVELAGSEVAYTVHIGTMDGIAAAYAAVMAYVEQNGWQPLGGAREVSLVWDQEHPERSVTELQIPVRR